jgi:hypothetical protein
MILAKIVQVQLGGPSRRFDKIDDQFFNSLKQIIMSS